MGSSSVRKARRPTEAPEAPRAAVGARISDWQFRAAMEHVSIGTAFVSLDGHWLYVNRAICELLGYAEDELLGLTFQDVSHPEDLNADLLEVARLIIGEATAYQMEKRYVRKDGGVVWALLSVSLVKDEQGRPEFFISQLVDITERKTSEQDRLALTDRLTLATRAGGIGVWDWDLVGGEFSADERVFQLYGVPVEEATTVASLRSALHPEDLARVEADTAAALGGKRELDGEYRTVLPSGEIRHVRAVAEVFRDEFGAPIRVIGCNWDVTNLRQLASDAEAASQAKSRFLATMSHEIRTPLNGVLGMAQVLAADPALSAEQRDRVGVIRDSGEALLAILNDILDLTKIEAGKLELEETTFELGRILDSVHATFSSIAAEKDIAFGVEIGEAAGSYRGDPTRLRQILCNLVSNALKFTTEGQVRVEAGYADGRLRLAVSDTGIGIAPDALEKVFASFTQADSSITRLHGGTGLGLAICRELTALMQGDLTVESELGRGTVFRFEAPLQRVAESAGAGEEAAPVTAPPAAQELRVLVAEDNPTNQLVLKTLLSQFGVTPTIVGDGREAVAAWRDRDWDVILMDVQMPVLDGVSAAREIRAEEAAQGRRRTPIIALTANAMTQHIESYEAAGMDGFVPKPIDVRALISALDGVSAG